MQWELVELQNGDPPTPLATVQSRKELRQTGPKNVWPALFKIQAAFIWISQILYTLTKI